VKILQLVPVWEAVPPKTYGGIEQVVASLCIELAKRGHTVFISCSDDSQIIKTHPNIIQICKGQESIRMLDLPLEEKKKIVREHVLKSVQEARKLGVDIVHNHSSEEGMEAVLEYGLPALTTLHNLPIPSNPVWKSYSQYYNTISNAQCSLVPTTPGRWVGTVYHGIPVREFPYKKDKRKGKYLFFIGRFSRAKGAHIACRVARATGLPLILAGKIDKDLPEDVEYFYREVEPYIDGKQITYVGELGEEKKYYFSNAIATLAPIRWQEPFGLVMIESFATGTPVIASPYGAAPEIIENGKTGFLAKTEEEMKEATERLGEIEPNACRSTAEQRFDVSIMVDKYERLYERVLNGSSFSFVE